MLHVLRSVRPDQDDTPGEAGTTPAPGLSDLDELVRKVDVAGVTVAVETHGSEGVLDPSVDLTAYRLLQEALTNVTRHGGAGSRVVVRLRWEAEALDIEVVDDGAGTPERVAQDVWGGLGLVGLRERVKLIGGQLSAGPAQDGGYRIVARLPASAPALGAEAQV
jgi:signal transduction histidine kinase